MQSTERNGVYGGQGGSVLPVFTGGTGFLSGAALKYIALVLMTLDHAAKGLIYMPFLSQRDLMPAGEAKEQLKHIFRILEAFGRPAFPIFCFLLVEGFLHTRSRAKYCLRLFLFALISEVPFNLGLYGEFRYPKHQNVFFELAWGVALLAVWELLGKLQELAADPGGNGSLPGSGGNHFAEDQGVGYAPERIRRLCRKYPQLVIYAQAAAAILFAWTAWKLNFDYRYRGIALILLIYLLRFDRRMQVLGGALFMSVWELPAVPAFFPLIRLYNGKRGSQLKYFFYIYYPLHLLIIWLLAGRIGG